ncbi:hypothetical protein [Massilia sp. TSP1-1-2]|uniref:hypothetical protein n=1 Tax=Massilia sp. TSP1-1-2 TaxID=2804649 RepID=UPI003CEBA78A
MQAINLRPQRSSRTKHEQRLVQLAFLLLFPGFFFYQTLLGLGMIRAYLGGYFSIVALAFTLPLVFFYYIALKRHRNFVSRFDLVHVMFIGYVVLVLVMNFVAGANPIIVQRYVQSLVFCVDLYIIFRLIDIHDKKFILMATASLAVMSAITIHFSINGFFYLQALNDAKDPDSLATYQGFARSYIYTFMIVISLTKFTSARLFLYGLAITTLFLNGARTEFSAMLLLVPLLEFYHTRHKLYLTLPLIFVAIQFAANAGAIAALLPENRTLQLLDLSHSSSAVARDHLTSNALRTISQNPIFGDFASYPDGHYAHNILVAWVDFGLIGFLAFSAILLWAAFRLFSDGFFLKARSAEFVLACSFVCATILWVVAAKSIPDMSVGAALGAFARYRYVRRYAKPGPVKPEAVTSYGGGAPPGTPPPHSCTLP